MTTTQTPSRHRLDVPGTPTLPWVFGPARVAAALVLAGLAGLVVAALGPQALGMSAHVVVSGSMAPRVNVGDVVLTSPVTSAELRPGQVLLFTDPADPERLLLHRLVSFDAEGRLVTQGDANQSADSVHVAASAVQGLARLRVPWVGLPAQWRGEGRFGPIALTAASLAGAAVLVATAVTRPDGAIAARHRSSPGHPQPMTAQRPPAPARAVTHAAARPGAPSTEEGRHRAPSPGYTLPPVPPAVRRPAAQRPAVPPPAGPAGPGLRAAGAHDHCIDSGRFCGQPRR